MTRDITDLVLSAAENDLSPTKPLIHNASFTLYDSMSALELTDPKMDTCEIPLSYYRQYRHRQHGGNGSNDGNVNGNTGHNSSISELTVPPKPLPKTLYDNEHGSHIITGRQSGGSSGTCSSGRKKCNSNNCALESDNYSVDAVPWTSLTLYQTKEISLELISKFYAFLNGSSLAESVFTCYYVHGSLLAQMTQKVFGINVDVDIDASSQRNNNNDDQRNDFDFQSWNFSIHEESKLAQTLLCLVCHLIVLNSKLTRKIVLHADIYEEEDFTPGAYTFFANNLNTTTGTGTCTGTTNNTSLFNTLTMTKNENNSSDEVGGDEGNIHISTYDIHIDDITTCFHEIQMQLDYTSDKHHDENNEESPPPTTKHTATLQTVLHCIQFLIHFHTVNYTLSTELNKDNVIEYTSKVKSIIDTLAMPTLETLITLIANDYDGNVDNDSNDDNSNNNGIRSNSNYNNSNDDYEKKILLFKTFDPFLNRPLMGNSPVRNVTSYYATSSIQAVQSLYEIMHEISNATCFLLLNCKDLNTIHSILHQITSSSSTYTATTSSSTSTLPSKKYQKSNLATQTSNLNILPRSIIIINLYFNDLLFGQHILPSLISKSMIERYNVPLNLFQHRDYGMRFLTRLGKPIYDTIKLHLLNKNRQQVYMRDVMFKDWKFLLQESAIVDHLFHRDQVVYYRDDNVVTASTTTTTTTTTTAAAAATIGSAMNSARIGSMIPHISNYVIYMTSRLMEHFIAVGIEVGIFHGGWHLLTAYWYLDFLASTELHVLVSMKDVIDVRMVENKTSENDVCVNNNTNGRSSSCGGNKKGKKGKKSQQSTSATNTSNIDEKAVRGKDVLIIEMKRFMYRGIVRTIALLLQTGIISKPNYEFTTTEKIFQKRFECLRQFSQPPPLTYVDFQKGTDFSSVSSNDLISSATDCFKKCRSLLDEIANKVDVEEGSSVLVATGMTKDEMKSITKVCIANSLFLLKLSQAINKGNVETFKVLFDFSTHKQFCSMNTK